MIPGTWARPGLPLSPEKGSPKMKGKTALGSCERSLYDKGLGITQVDMHPPLFPQGELAPIYDAAAAHLSLRFRKLFKPLLPFSHSH